MGAGEHGLTPGDLMRFVDLATDALAAHREEIDALNVFPVPDGDTGTNMFLTVSSGREAAVKAFESEPEGLQSLLRDFSRGALLGARGNSGVILSQILGALSAELFRATTESNPASARDMARVIAGAMTAASEAAYAAVSTPVEGTILTVARRAAEAAETYAATAHARVPQVFAEAAAAAREALAHTPEQLHVLCEAGVVDAGGLGLSVILDSAEVAVTGRVNLRAPREPRPHRAAGPRPPAPRPQPVSPDELTIDGPGYEVMYLLDAEDAAVQLLRGQLENLGDSVVVVGGSGLWNVHVHTDDVGAAVEAGIEAGRPHRVRVTHFADQRAQAHDHSEPIRDPRSTAPAAASLSVPSGRAVVVVSAGDGLSALFAEHGAVVVPGGPGRRPSAGQILDAVLQTRAAEVVVLPNDNDSVRVAQIAASTAEQDAGIKVIVIPTQAQVQGLAALAVHDPERSFEADALEMTATAAHVRHGAVTIAAKQAITMAGPCEPGDVLGVVAGDFAVVGHDLASVVDDVLARLLAGGGELVTLVVGLEAPEGLAEEAAARLEETHPHVDVDVVSGGQDRYPFLVSVE